MAEGSRLTYLPHPTVPHEGARFKAINKVYLQDNCRLIWGEVLTPGRGLQGEQFRYHSFQSRTELFIADRLAVKENLLIRPGSFDPMALGFLEGYSHQAGLLFLDPCGWDAAFQDILLQYLSSVSGIKFGVSRLPVPGLSVRILGNKGELLFDCLKALAVALDSVSIQTKVYAR